MYYFFLGAMPLPVAPEALELTINNQNETVTLINDGEINILKAPGLSDVNFEFLVPHTKYPFTSYGAGGIVGSTAIFSYLESLKTLQLPFQFIVSRMGNGNKLLSHTNLKVTLEDYVIKENADYGLDQMVEVNLKQYRFYGTKILKVGKDGKATAEETRG